LQEVAEAVVLVADMVVVVVLVVIGQILGFLYLLLAILLL
jgi:hypothetical protein